MRIKYNYTFIYIASGLFFLILCLALILTCFSPKPPYTSIAGAREAIAASRYKKTNKYLPAEYARLIETYDSAMIKWKCENEKFLLKRNYAEIKNMADTIIVSAEALSKKAVTIGNNLDSLLRNEFKTIEEHISRYDTIFSIIPVPAELTEKYTRGKLFYLEGRSAFVNNELSRAFEKLQQASKICREATSKAKEYLVSYFDQYDNWVKLVDDALKTSARRKNYVIIVDKFARNCQVYFSGKLKYTFEAELGPRWIGDKRHKGDNATPEGKYQVIKKLGPKQTKYYKALLINYPNEEDRKRFSDEIQNGSLPVNSDIGGLIEIHGDGGKGFHWTNGCIALKNRNMDNVFRMVSVGTPVVIVGSTKKLTELFNLE